MATTKVIKDLTEFNPGNPDYVLNSTNAVTVISAGGGNQYNFNGVYGKFGLRIGTTVLTGVTTAHPIAILNNGLTGITYTGTFFNSKVVGGVSYDFYTGDVTITVTADFGVASYYCYYHNYMGGENNLVSVYSEAGLRMPTGGVFSGTAVEGMMRNDTTQASEGSASTMQHYNGDNVWKNFVNTAQCTTATCDYPVTATALFQLEANVNNTCSGSFNPQENGITYATGKFGNAAGFTGGNSSGGDYIKMDNSVYGASTTIFSWSLWINCDNSTGTGVNIMGNGALAGGQTGYCVYLYNGRLAMSTLQSSDEYFPNPESGGTLINDGQWHHIVLAYNNGPFVLYLDGSPYQTATSSNYTGNATPASSTYIGNTFERSIAAGVVNGQIDQVRVFGGTILNQTQVTDLYNEIGC